MGRGGGGGGGGMGGGGGAGGRRSGKWEAARTTRTAGQK